MDIGTAKPTSDELESVKHHFISEYPITQELTAADYERIGLQHLEEMLRKFGTAVVCGGTGLYIKALCEGLDAMPEVNPEIRAAVEACYHSQGISWLQEAVRQEDPSFAAIGEMENPHRMMRALIFIRSTGTSILAFRTDSIKERPFRIVKIGLDLPREQLYARIDRRVDAMMKAGLLAESESFFHLRHLKNLQTVGYAELFEYLESHCSLPEAVEKIKQHTRNYAKRQLTWFRKDTQIRWLDNSGPHIFDELLKNIKLKPKKKVVTLGGLHMLWMLVMKKKQKVKP
jgi:tRNA dimethylallyltransferase